MPFGLLIGAFSRSAGKAADRFGPRPFLTAGALLVFLACSGLALDLANYWIGAVLPILLLSAGMAAAVSPLTTAVMNAVPDSLSGAASGVNNAASRLAGLFAVAVLGLVAELVFSGAAPAGARFGVLPEPDGPGRAAIEAAFVSAYTGAMAVAALWALLAAFCSFLLLRGTGGSSDRGRVSL